MNQLILDTFQDLCSQYDIKVKLKSKRTFSLYVTQDLPFEVKAVVTEKVKVIAESMGRTKFIVDNPYIRTINEKALVTSGIWDIRIL
jgi:hypothetical protein